MNSRGRIGTVPAGAAPIGREDELGRLEAQQGGWRAIVLGVLATLIVGSWILLAIVRIDDRFALNHVAGARMALAQDVNHGTLYRPLYDGRNYGGTRFMPVPIVLHAAIARVTHEYIESGKVLSYASIALLLGLTLLVLRRLGSPLPVALALTSSIVATEPGLLAATGISGDALPVALQLGAIALVADSFRTRRLVAAAGLCALAIFVKFSAVWAPLAIGTWLLMKARRQLVPFAASFLAFFAGTLGLFLWISGGRLWSNVASLSVSGVSGLGALSRPATLPALLVQRMNALFILIVVAVVAWFAAWVGNRLTIYEVSLAWAVAVLLVVLTDIGAEYNHLIDLIVLAVVVVGRFWRVMARLRFGLVRSALPLVLAASLAASYAVTLAGPVRDAVASALGHPRGDRFAAHPLSGYLRSDDVILSEDPSVPVEMNLRPLVLDPFMVRQFDRIHPSWVDDLIERINRGEFDKVVLLKELDAASEYWYATWHFGPRVFQALEANYRLAIRTHGYFLYVPRVAPLPS